MNIFMHVIHEYDLPILEFLITCTYVAICHYSIIWSEPCIDNATLVIVSETVYVLKTLLFTLQCTYDRQNFSV